MVISIPKKGNGLFVAIMLPLESYDGIQIKINDGTNHLHALKNFPCGKEILLSGWMVLGLVVIELRLRQTIYHYYWPNG